MRFGTAGAALVAFAMLAVAAGVIYSGALTQAYSRLVERGAYASASASASELRSPAPKDASALRHSPRRD
jgi:hypothetical protein